MKHANNALLTSVAAAALAVGMGAALAQAPTPGLGHQQSAPIDNRQSTPVEKIAPALEPSRGKTPETGMKSGQAEEKKGGKAAQDNNSMKQKATSSGTTTPDSPRVGKTSSEMKADTKTNADAKPSARSSEKLGNVKPSDSKSSAKPGVAKTATETNTEAKPETTGQGAAGGSGKLSTEQRTTIRTAIQKQNVRPTTNVNFSISVGTQVPRGIRFYRVPMQLVDIYPEWRGYDYFLVGDQIIVVNPRTHQIVAVLDA